MDSFKVQQSSFDQMCFVLCGCFRACQVPDGTQAGKLVSGSRHVCYVFVFFLQKGPQTKSFFSDTKQTDEKWESRSPLATLDHHLLH